MRLGGLMIRQALDRQVWAAWRGDKRLTSQDLRIGPNSVDLTLGPRLLFPTGPTTPLDPENGQQEWSVFEDEEVVLPVHGFALGCAVERFDCAAPLRKGWLRRKKLFVSQIDGRSTWGRLGLTVHVTAGFGDYGFSGAYTLELVNDGWRPLILRPGMRIAQMSFQEVWGPQRYAGAYTTPEHNTQPVPPLLGPGRFR